MTPGPRLISKNLVKMLSYTERQRDIDTHNSMLVNRMLRTTSCINNENKIVKDSLNSVYNRKVEKEIDDSNQQLVKRLQSASSQYSQKGMSRSVKHYARVKSNIAFSKMDPYYDLEIGTNSGREAQTDSAIVRRPFSAIR